MQATSNKFNQLATHTIIDRNQGNTTTYSYQSVRNYYNCPCCSYRLLRHIRSDGIYWLCSHCYQEMPVWDIDKAINYG